MYILKVVEAISYCFLGFLDDAGFFESAGFEAVVLIGFLFFFNLSGFLNDIMFIPFHFLYLALIYSDTFFRKYGRGLCRQSQSSVITADNY